VHPRHYLMLLLPIAAFGSSAAMASDIQCAATQQPAERIICDHAILNNEYDDIFAQQQALLNAGKLSPERLAQWRQSRSACTDVHCIDVVFAQWTAMTKSVAASSQAAQAAQAPAIASSTELAPVGPAPDAVPSAAPPAAVPTSEASLVRQGSAAGVALPQPVAPQASAPASVSAASGSVNSGGTTGMSIGLIVALLLVAGFGILFVRRQRHGGSTGNSSANSSANTRGKNGR
jgi:LPXTG-motif cell wall-anchored protein